MELILYFFGWILFPLIPAYFCYTILKNNSVNPDPNHVGGNLFGLKIETGGAFAIYFILFICIHFYFGIPIIEENKLMDNLTIQKYDDELKSNTQNREMWLIKCKLNLVEADSTKKIDDDEISKQMSFLKLEILPPTYTYLEDGEIEFYLPNELLKASTGSVHIEVPGFKHLNLSMPDIIKREKFSNFSIDMGSFNLRRTTFATIYHPPTTISQSEININSVKQLPKPKSIN